MSSLVRARLACAALLLVSAHPALAGPVTIDLPTALARARERAPAAVVALARIDEARARGEGARVRFMGNPELQLGAGPRFGAERTLNIQGQLTQPLEPGRREARIQVAEAEVAYAQAVGAAELRMLSFEVTVAFLEARFADLAVEGARRSVDVATRTAAVAERRRTAGDVTDLDVDLARVALGRARAALSGAGAERATQVGRLAGLIGARPDDTLTLVGDLTPAPLTLAALQASVPARADVRALAAEGRVARAEGVAAAAAGRPDVGVWLGYQLDETDAIAVAGLTLTLPVWNRAQGERAAARTRGRRVDVERAVVIGAASRQIADAFEAYLRAREAVDIFERDALPPLEDSERLLERSIETGQITISAYLVARQEVLSGRREHLERQLQLAKAAAMARFVAGRDP